jgi:hypothetical protein
MNSMNLRSNFFWGRNFPWLAVLFAAALPVTAAPLDQASETLAMTNEVHVVQRSVFNLPNSPKEGRDPFFPNSLRPYASTVIPSAPTTDLSSLVMQSTLGTADHPLVVINNVTFAVGDDAEVTTPQGRIRIHCVAITADAAVIEAAGQRTVLHYGGKP